MPEGTGFVVLPIVPPVLRPALPCLNTGENHEMMHRNRNTKRTLTPTPAEADPAAPDREALHFLDSTLSVCLPHKLHEATVFSDRNFHL